MTQGIEAVHRQKMRHSHHCPIASLSPRLKRSNSRDASTNSTDLTGRDPAPNQTQGAGGNTSNSSSTSTSALNTESCPPGQTFCNDSQKCRDLSIDPNSCGACGNRCSSIHCRNGRCLTEEESDRAGPLGFDCDEGLVSCDLEDGFCADLLTVGLNCGACGNVCPSYPEIYSCEGGVCVAPTCVPHLKYGLLCVDPLSDPLHCGGCDIACEGRTTCQNGVCIVAGGGGYLAGTDLTYCGGLRVDRQNDVANCGGCGIPCASAAASS